MEKRAKNVETAVDMALAELGVSRDKVNVDIIDEGSKGFFGIGAKEAVVKVEIKEGVAEAPKASVKKNEVKKEKSVKPAQKKEETTEKARTRKASKALTEEEAACAIAQAKEFLEGVFASMSLEVEVVVSQSGEDTILAQLNGENIGIVIGKRGDTLDALQYLTSLVVNKKSESYIKVTLDTENYREKRAEALIALADRLAIKVARTGKKFTLEPMNPYERRIIHSQLQANEAVTTYSIGQEPYRKVVIAPKNSKPRKPRKGAPKKSYNKPYTKKAPVADAETQEVAAEKKGSYTTTYKADFKPQQHKAQYASYEEYLEAQKNK